VNVLDENIPRDQADILKSWRVQSRSISRDLAHQGISDSAILPLLLKLKRPTLLSRDRDFFRKELVHADYCLVWFDVAVEETAFFIRSFLRHPNFGKTSQRLGKSIRVHVQKIEYWTKSAEQLIEVPWQT
jgi:hypothetical protein